VGVNTKLVAVGIQLDEIIGRLGILIADSEAYYLSFEDYRGDFTSLSTYLQLQIGSQYPADPRSILAWLRAIAECVCELAGNAEPVGESPNGCDTPVVSLSETLVTSTGYPGRLFASFDCTTPQGLNCDHFLDPTLPSGVEVIISSPLAYNIFVASSSPLFSTSPDDPNVYPTNQWLTLTEPLELAVSVTDGHNLTVYLCLDPATGFVDCVERESLAGDALYIDAVGTEFPGTPAFIPLDALGVGECVTDIEWGSPPRSFHTTDECHILAADAFGWTFQRISGSAMQVSWVPADLGSDQHHTWSTSDTSTYTITDHTAYLLIDNAVGGPGDGESPFICRICPSEEA